MNRNHPAESSGRFQPLRDHRLLRAAAAVVLLLVLPATLGAYTIYLKDGTNFIAEGPYEVQGDQAIVIKMGGTPITLDLDEIDQARTERLNRGSLSDTVVIDEGRSRRYQFGEGQAAGRDTLQDVIRRRQAGGGIAGPEQDLDQPLPTTSAGYVDLSMMIREPISSSEVESNLTETLRGHGASNFRIYQGTTDDSLLLEVTANGRNDVFRQLEALASAFSDITEARELNVLEVLMLSSRRTRSGQFELSAENAPLLASGRLSPSEFFVQFVQF